MLYIPRIQPSTALGSTTPNPLISWWAVRGSNPRPSRCKRDAEAIRDCVGASMAARNDPANPIEPAPGSIWAERPKLSVTAKAE